MKTNLGKKIGGGEKEDEKETKSGEIRNTLEEKRWEEKEGEIKTKGQRGISNTRKASDCDTDDGGDEDGHRDENVDLAYFDQVASIAKKAEEKSSRAEETTGDDKDDIGENDNNDKDINNTDEDKNEAETFLAKKFKRKNFQSVTNGSGFAGKGSASEGEREDEVVSASDGSSVRRSVCDVVKKLPKQRQ